MKLFQYLENPMKLAIQIAKNCSSSNEIPVGCVIVNSKKKLISYASNSTIRTKDPTAHAEIIAIRKACKLLKNHRLFDMSIYTTLEPCIMCESAIYQARIPKVFFAAYNENFRGIFMNLRRKYSSELTNFSYLGGFEEKESINVLRRYFKKIRK